MANISGIGSLNSSLVFRRIYWEEGFHAFYTGFSPAMCGVMVYAGTSFFTYESLKFYLSEYHKSQVTAVSLMLASKITSDNILWC